MYLSLSRVFIVHSRSGPHVEYMYVRTYARTARTYVRMHVQTISHSHELRSAVCMRELMMPTGVTLKAEDLDFASMRAFTVKGEQIARAILGLHKDLPTHRLPCQQTCAHTHTHTHTRAYVRYCTHSLTYVCVRTCVFTSCLRTLLAEPRRIGRRTSRTAPSPCPSASGLLSTSVRAPSKLATWRSPPLNQSSRPLLRSSASNSCPRACVR